VREGDRMKLLIVADDFTGALDTGAQLSKEGVKVTVAAGICKRKQWEEYIGLSENKPEVFVMNGNMRHMKKEEAYLCIKKILEEFEGSYQYFYLKTDSVLRGNISAAMKALLERTERVMFIPAFPKAGRTTKDGVQYVHGVLIEKTAFRMDPLNPAYTSVISEILNRDYEIETHLIKKIEDCSLKEMKGVCVFDCEKTETMGEISDFLGKEKEGKFTAGCAGFASTFLRRIDFTCGKMVRKVSDSPAFILSGSANEATFHQIRRAIESGYPVFVFPSEKLFDADYKGELQKLAARAKEEMGKGSTVLITLTTDREQVKKTENYAKRLQISEASMHKKIGQFFCDMAKLLLEDEKTEQFCMIGGDTCSEVLKSLGVRFLDAKEEIEEGVPVSEIEYKGRKIKLVTKSGGLGREYIIEKIDRYLRKEEEETC
jgi:uncharacterized protein YgbK (DUF1537 family)